MEVNELGQPVGPHVTGWSPRRAPSAPVLSGDYVRLERLDPARHGEDLFAADRADARGESWTYLPYGPFGDRTAYRRWLEGVAGRADPCFYAIIDTDDVDPDDVDTGAVEAAVDAVDTDHSRVRTRTHGRAVGVASYLNVEPDHGTIEVGHVHYSPALQRRRGATEAQYLLMRHVFEDLGYRRYEWKCDALNAASRSAAARLGFSYEGTFRQARVVKGRNRDTAWYAVTDGDWPAVSAALRAWLDPANFDARGRQRTSLRSRLG
ncbi:MAG TPA: GNAT family protein [Segeticoccus sp.]|uniref:GNAT family N-acetyltransferase n=1 Tax=Segeticoccus sp. TaxID=2706531 RepID=UPI002D7FC8DD|nr:GNAT family protein [Segeticoccus sp.]HET8601968.1 GNAT family protein [Segeticoccus sp.]